MEKKRTKNEIKVRTLEQIQAEEEAVRKLRKYLPRMRRVWSTALEKNGAYQAVFNCVCGSWHTCSALHKYNCKHLELWKSEHSGCAARLLAKYEAETKKQTANKE